MLAACGGITPAPVSDFSLSNTSRPSPNTYVVRKGDTLYSIAFRYGLDYKKIASNNGVGADYSIFPGQRLQLGIQKTATRNNSNSSIIRDVSINKPKVVVVRNSQNNAGSIVKERSISKNKPAIKKVKQTTVSKSSVTKNQKKPDKKQISTDDDVTSGPIKWQWPADGKVIATFKTTGKVNKGININGSKGEPVKAAAYGKVVYAGNGLLGYGNLVIVNHNRQYLSAYAHNSRVLVKENEIVKAGQKIAEIGNTGADKTMLHFEIRRDGKPINPLQYLPKR